jgi:two-component system, sensor histidine kinase and response regulator
LKKEKHEKIITRNSLKEISQKDARLLVVEDYIVNQKVISKILQNFGYTAQIVANRKEALALLQKQKFDLVLMDIQMPKMDGLTETRLILTADSIILDRKVTIIAMTDDKEICLEAVMADYITKAINPDILLEKITDTFQKPLSKRVVKFKIRESWYKKKLSPGNGTASLNV